MSNPHAITDIGAIETDADLRTYVRGLRGLSVRKIAETGEYRVSYTEGSEASREASAYYTDDRRDAAGTALAMERL